MTSDGGTDVDADVDSDGFVNHVAVAGDVVEEGELAVGFAW